MEEMFVLVWDDVKTPGQPFSKHSMPPKGVGRLMVFSLHWAEETAKENNQMYGSPTRQMKIVPLAEFLETNPMQPKDALRPGEKAPAVPAP